MTPDQQSIDPAKAYQAAKTERANMEKQIMTLRKDLQKAERDTRPKTRAMEQRLRQKQMELDIHERNISAVKQQERIAKSKAQPGFLAGFGGGLFGSGNRNTPPPSSPPSDRPRF